MEYSKDWFVERVKSCQSGLYGLAISILRNEEDAKDAVQETLYKAFDNIENLKDPNKFKPWIMKILSNTAYDMIRKKKFSTNIDDYTNTLESKSSIDIDTKVTLWAAVQSLESTYRPVIILFYYEDLTIMEISKILGITIVTTKKRLSRARRQLKDILEN